jgi:hypothetical protein
VSRHGCGGPPARLNADAFYQGGAPAGSPDTSAPVPSLLLVRPAGSGEADGIPAPRGSGVIGRGPGGTAIVTKRSATARPVLLQAGNRAGRI